MIKVNVKVRGVRGMQRRLAVTGARLKNRIVPNKAVSVWLTRWVNQNFKTQGGKVGGWTPFKHGGRWVGKGRTRRFDTSAKLLQDTGKLKASYKGFYSNRFAGVGTDVTYAKKHEFGVPSRRLPARRMLPTNQDKDVILGVTKIYDHFVRKALR